WLKGLVPGDIAGEFAKRADETFLVEITTTAKEQPSRLFCGVIDSLKVTRQQEYAILEVMAKTTSSQIDVKKDSRTFQNTTKTYGQIMNRLLEEKGTVSVTVTDKPIGAFIMQCNETDWEFMIRMASQLGVPAFANIVAKTPHIYIGLPPSGQTRQIDTIFSDYTKSDAEYRSFAENISPGLGTMREDFASERIQSYSYLYLGDTVLFRGKEVRIKSIEARLCDGILECSYVLGLKTSFQVPAIANMQASGRLMTGRVSEVKADKVKVFFCSVDSREDEESNWWFPYSTAYSSQDGSGWYSMPQKGDEVRIFFPSGNEADAFAAGSVAKNVRPNVKEKCWSGLNGKQILMTEDGLVITCREGKLYLKLSDEKGIEIISDMDINITSGTKVNIQGGDEVRIIAENEVLVGTATAYLDIRKEGITASAENIILN
ncbi:MAG: contractile injection system protein, VgrG/Pvc8 family, partial [Lachnospiraceae bacterium]